MQIKPRPKSYKLQPMITKKSMAEGSDERFSMRTVTAMIRKTFSDVIEINTLDFNRWIDDPDIARKLVILDARELKEFEVSHISNARRTSPSGEDYSNLLQEIIDKGKDKVVVYCSVGYRSAKVAQHLEKALSKLKNDTLKIYNLEGSIFKWANEGRPMVDSTNQPTPFAHPYNVMWGKILDSKLRKWGPDSSL